MARPTWRERRAHKKAEGEERARQQRVAGQKPLFPKVSRTGAIVLCSVMGALFILSVLWRLGPGAIRAATMPTAQTTDGMAINAEGTTMVYKPGDYQVGTNLPAGEYKFLAAGGACAVSLYRNGEPYSEQVVGEQDWLTLEDGQAVRVTNGSFVKADDVSVQDRTELSAGSVYKVGVDCPAGTWTLTPVDGDGYRSYTVTGQRILGSTPEVVSDGTLTGPVEVDLHAGEYLVLGQVTAVMMR